MKRLKHLIGKAAAVSASAALMLTAATMPRASAQGEVRLLMNLIGGGSVIGIGYQLEAAVGTVKDYEVTLDGVSIEPAEDGTFSTYDYAMNMTQPHKIKVTDKTGAAVLEKETSVCAYLKSLISTPGNEQYAKLAKNMLWYGGAAQTYFGVDTEHLASDGISESDILTTDLPDDQFDKNKFNDKLGNHGAPVRYVGMNLSLQSEIKFSLFFEQSYGSNYAEKYLETCYFGGKRVVPVKNGSGYQVSVTVNAKDLDKTLKFADEDDLTQDFRPMQYIYAAVNSGNKSLGRVCGALHFYGYAVNNPGYATGDVVYKWETLPEYSGRATTYDYSYTGGNAQLDDYAFNNHLYAAALTDEDYAAYAGAMIEITCAASGQNKTIRALVVDSMMIANNPGREKGDVDLDKFAFEELTGATTGDFNITWRVVELEPALGSYINYAVEQAGQWYVKIQPRNTLYPLSKFEYKVSDGVYREIKREQENMYVLNDDDMKPFPLNNLTFRMTDIFGETVEDTGINLGISGDEKITSFTVLEPRTDGVQFSRTID